MNDADLDSFNNGIDSIMDAFYESCGAMNVSRGGAVLLFCSVSCPNCRCRRSRLHSSPVAGADCAHLHCLCQSGYFKPRPKTGLLVAPSPFPTSAATSMQCLNVTKLPPSRRNAAAGGLDCAYKVATVGTQTCPKGVTFNPDKLRRARELIIELCCCRGDGGWRVGPEGTWAACACSRAATTLSLTSVPLPLQDLPVQ